MPIFRGNNVHCPQRQQGGYNRLGINIKNGIFLGRALFVKEHHPD